MFAKHYHIFTHLLDVIEYPALMGKVSAPFLILGWKVKIKTIWNMPESINTVDRNTLKFLVKIVYFGNIKDMEHIILNEMRKHQIHTIYFKWFEESCTKLWALNMHSLRAAHTAGFEWVGCLHMHGYVLKDDIFVPKWLSKVSTFNVAEFLQTCKCKTAKCDM